MHQDEHVDPRVRGPPPARRPGARGRRRARAFGHVRARGQRRRLVRPSVARVPLLEQHGKNCLRGVFDAQAGATAAPQHPQLCHGALAFFVRRAAVV